MSYPKLATIEKEIEQNLSVIYEIDADIAENLGSYTLVQIQHKKKKYKEPHGIIKKLRQNIADGLYFEAQENKLF